MGKNRFLIILAFVFVAIIYWRFFLPGPKVAIDFPLVSDIQIKSQVDLPRIWSEGGAEGLGEYSTFFLWAWPITFMVGTLSYMGISFSILEIIFFLLPIIILSGFGISKLSKELKFSFPISIICILFYITNTYILLLIDGGQLSIALAFAFFPLSFLTVLKTVDGTFRDKIIAGVTVSILGFLDIRFVFLLFLLCLIYFFYQFIFLNLRELKKWVLNWLITGFIMLSIFLGLHFYWLLPVIVDPGSKTTYSIFTKISPSFSNLGHPLFLISPHWFGNVYGRISPLRWEFVFIPILVFLASILNPKSKKVGFWLIVALISIFLAKGNSAPLPSVYLWLFDNIPFFSIFRDSSKFFVLVTLSYTLLIGFSLEIIMQNIKSKRLRSLLILFIFTYIFYMVHPIWLGWTTGLFSEYPHKQTYQILAETLEQDQNFSRVLWVPSYNPLGYLSPTHPRLEATKLVQKRPFAVGTVGSYEFINFLREAPFMGQIFDVYGIGYIAYPFLDPRRDDMHPDSINYFYTFSNQLSQLPWLSKVKLSQIPLWKTKNHQDKFFIPSNTWFIIGSDSIYNESTESGELKLSDNALIFLEESPSLGKTIDQLPQANIVLHEKSLTDLAMINVEYRNLIFPARNLDYDPDESGWWKRDTFDLINWRSFLQTKYGIDNLDFDLRGGWAVAEGKLKLKVDSGKIKDNSILLARVLESTRSGKLKFYQENKIIGEINTHKEGNNVRWFEVGLLKNNAEVTVESEGNINVVNALAVLDKQEWGSLQQKAIKLQRRVVDFDEVNTINAENIKITYEKINPTKYKVFIENLKKPKILVFSQTFDENWSINNQKPLPIFSLLNGFQIDKDGEYVVEFLLQKYVNYGLSISVLTLVIITFILMFHKLK